MRCRKRYWTGRSRKNCISGCGNSGNRYFQTESIQGSYEIEFDAGNKEYSYEIQASDGTILSSDVETIQQNIQTENQQAAQNPQPAENQQTTEAPVSQTPTPAVSEADAKKAALDRVPGAAEQDLRMELEYDDGRYIYEGDIYYQQKEYEFEIDANNGSFLKWSEERD